MLGLKSIQISKGSPACIVMTKLGSRYIWWSHQMETFSALLAPCAGNSPVPVNSPHKGQRHGALMFFHLCLNKLLSKQRWRRWFYTPSRSLWRHCNKALPIKGFIKTSVHALHRTPTSSVCSQLTSSPRIRGHCSRSASSPKHPRLSIWIGPVPGPKWAFLKGISRHIDWLVDRTPANSNRLVLKMQLWTASLLFQNKKLWKTHARTRTRTHTRTHTHTHAQQTSNSPGVTYRTIKLLAKYSNAYLQNCIIWIIAIGTYPKAYPDA